MASTERSIPEDEYLAMLGREVAAVQAEAKRLNRRVRNTRTAIQSLEDDLEALTAQIRDRLVQVSATRPR